MLATHNCVVSHVCLVVWSSGLQPLVANYARLAFCKTEDVLDKATVALAALGDKLAPKAKR